MTRFVTVKRSVAHIWLCFCSRPAAAPLASSTAPSAAAITRVSRTHTTSPSPQRSSSFLKHGRHKQSVGSVDSSITAKKETSQRNFTAANVSLMSASSCKPLHSRMRVCLVIIDGFADTGACTPLQEVGVRGVALSRFAHINPRFPTECFR